MQAASMHWNALSVKNRRSLSLLRIQGPTSTVFGLPALSVRSQ
jgi:hypothetical protein